MTSCDYREAIECFVPYWHASKLAHSNLETSGKKHLYFTHEQEHLALTITLAKSGAKGRRESRPSVPGCPYFREGGYTNNIE